MVQTTKLAAADSKRPPPHLTSLLRPLDGLIGCCLGSTTTNGRQEMSRGLAPLAQQLSVPLHATSDLEEVSACNSSMLVPLGLERGSHARLPRGVGT